MELLGNALATQDVALESHAAVHWVCVYVPFKAAAPFKYPFGIPGLEALGHTRAAAAGVVSHEGACTVITHCSSNLRVRRAAAARGAATRSLHQECLLPAHGDPRSCGHASVVTSRRVTATQRFRRQMHATDHGRGTEPAPAAGGGAGPTSRAAMLSVGAAKLTQARATASAPKLLREKTRSAHTRQRAQVVRCGPHLLQNRS